MKTLERMSYHLFRLVLAGVFIYAGAVKMTDVVTFAGHVAAYQLLPYAGNYLVAATLPYVEFLAGMLLLLNARVRPALVVVGGLTSLFMVALVTVLARGLEIDCGCFDPGGGDDVSAGVALLRDAGLMLLIVATWWLRTKTVPRTGGAETKEGGAP